jgi:hypothetical protein
LVFCLDIPNFELISSCLTQFTKSQTAILPEETSKFNGKKMIGWYKNPRHKKHILITDPIENKHGFVLFK